MNKVRERRERVGLSREKFARRVNLTVATVANLERGRTQSFRLFAALRVAEALGVDTSALRELYGYGDGDEDGGAS